MSSLKSPNQAKFGPGEDVVQLFLTIERHKLYPRKMLSKENKSLGLIKPPNFPPR